MLPSFTYGLGRGRGWSVGPPCPLLAVTLDKPHPSCELASVTICGVGEAGVQRCLEGGPGLVLKE